MTKRLLMTIFVLAAAALAAQIQTQVVFDGYFL
jgi:hypothetical protein